VQTFHVPPSLRPHCSKLSAVGHPRAGTKLHPGKGIPNQADVSQTTGKTLSQVPTRTNNLQSLIPHMPVPPQEVCPFSAQQSLGCPTSFLGLQQQAGQEVSEPVAAVWHLWEINSQQFSHLERISHGPDNPPLQYPMGLTTRFFSPTPKLT
jgi:hypothetical protein